MDLIFPFCKVYFWLLYFFLFLMHFLFAALLMEISPVEVKLRDILFLQVLTWMRDSGKPVVWDRFSRRLMPGYGSVSKVARRSSTCSLEKLVLFLRLALRDEPPPEAAGRTSSGERDEVQYTKALRCCLCSHFPLETSGFRGSCRLHKSKYDQFNMFFYC